MTYEFCEVSETWKLKELYLTYLLHSEQKYILSQLFH